MTDKKRPSLLDRMENSTIQALERQVDQLTKEKKMLEGEVERIIQHHAKEHGLCELFSESPGGESYP